MSHLAHINALRDKLIAEGIIDLDLQKQIITYAYVRVIIQFLTYRMKCIGNVPQELSDKALQILGMWNEITPINGNYVITLSKQEINRVASSLMYMGRVCCTEPELIEGLSNPTFEGKDCTEFNNLVDFLCGEASQYAKEKGL